ncbi:MAG TPA: hypothetical protein VG099_08705 [Gemmataceae bacterium]|nr:hypothetical protein [Gemmataceae bacterium]
MTQPRVHFRMQALCLGILLSGLVLYGCQTIKNRLSDSLTHWTMLGQESLEDPIKAVGGDGIVFTPGQDTRPLSRKQLAAADPQTLANYYAPIFVQQRVNTQAQRFPYPPEYDSIGQAHLRREANGKLKSYVAGSPTVYAIFKKLPIDGHEHVQLTYTAWYPAHPRMKAIDLEEAEIDSCVLRLTLDADNAPLFYETIAACGCFHKVFVERWLEDAARQTFGAPEKGKKYSVERTVKDAIDWEVSGVVDEPRDQPRRPVVFLKAGDHKVIGMGSAARLRVPPTAESHPYEMTSYADLYAVKVDGSIEQAAFFDLDHGGKVRGAERKKEKFFLTFIGVDSAGQPRADEQIKMHFDESTWGDPTIYSKYLRLPPGSL